MQALMMRSDWFAVSGGKEGPMEAGQVRKEVPGSGLIISGAQVETTGLKGSVGRASAWGVRGLSMILRNQPSFKMLSVARRIRTPKRKMTHRSSHPQSQKTLNPKPGRSISFGSLASLGSAAADFSAAPYCPINDFLFLGLY